MKMLKKAARMLTMNKAVKVISRTKKETIRKRTP